VCIREEKMKNYEKMTAIVESHANFSLIVGGDFNARTSDKGESADFMQGDTEGRRSRDRTVNDKEKVLLK